MTTFFNAHGTSPSLDGKFLDLNFGLDEPEELREGRAWVSVEELATDDDSDDEAVDTDFEDRILNALDNQYDELFFDWEDPDYLSIRNIPDWVQTRYGDIIERLGNSTVGPTSEILVVEADDWLPSFSSNHESPTRLSWDDDDAKWRRTWRSRNAQKKARWRIDGRRGKKDSNHRESVRYAQIEMFDAYTAENFLDDNAMLTHDESYYYDWSQDPEPVVERTLYIYEPYYDDLYWDYGMDMFLSDSDYDYHYDDRFEDEYHMLDDEDIAQDPVELYAFEEVEMAEFMPSFGSTIIRAKRRKYDFDAKPDFKRSRNHTARRGWKRLASPKRHGRESIRGIPIWMTPGYTAERFLTENALIN
jgi:hypothetical protein